MGIDLYFHAFSSPCRAVLMCGKALGVEFNLKEINLLTGDHLKPDFLKINIQHTIPAINDNGFCLSESRAIMQYLANAYGKNDSLYPKPAKQRAIVDQRLFFDAGVLYKSFTDAYVPSIFFKAPLDEEKVRKIDDALEFLDEFLDKSKFVAGDSLTIADLSIMASLSTMAAAGIRFSKFRKVEAYYGTCKSIIPGYKECNEKGAKGFGDFAKGALAALGK